MDRHFNKWNHGPITVFGSLVIARSQNLTEWHEKVDSMVQWCNLRPQIVRDHIQGMIGSPNQVEITLDVVPAGAGVIKINTITPETLPWDGIYFNGVPVTITAIPNEGYSFNHWETTTLALLDSFVISLNDNVPIDETFIVHFDPLEFDVNVYPNPSSSIFNVDYSLPSDVQLSVDLYSFYGKFIKNFISGDKLHREGVYSLTIDKNLLNLAQGIHL